MKASAVEQINGTGAGRLASVVVIAGDAESHRRISAVLADHGLRQSARVNTPEEAVELDLDASTIIAYLCDIDVPRDLASLRRLRREVREPALVAISAPSTGTGVRRALDAGADALVFAPELDLTLATTINAVAVGQSVVPRNLRASVERPSSPIVSARSSTWSARARPTPRSPRPCSWPKARSRAISPRSSPSSASAPARRRSRCSST